MQASYPNATDRHPHHLLVEPCELPDGIQLVCADDRGLRHAITLEEATAADFDLFGCSYRRPGELSARTRPDR